MGVHRGMQRCALLLALVIIVGCIAPVALAAEAEVTGSANMREGAGTEFDTLQKLKKGTVVTVLDKEAAEGWWKVSYKEQEGYVASEFLSIKLPPPEPGYATRNTQLRSEQSTQSQAVIALPMHAVVSITDMENKTWWKVKYENKEGYVQSSALKQGTPPAIGTTDGSGAGNTATSANDPNRKNIENAKSINKDTVGWIDVPNTNISDPILYGANFYYSNRDIYKKKSLEGVYPYANRMTRNVVIFGHNLRGQNRGFHQMHHLQEAANGRSTCQYGSCGKSISKLAKWYTTSEGRTWNISIFGKTKWEVFAMYEVPRNEPISTLRSNWNTSPANMDSWISNQLKRSEINFGVSVSAKDQIMTIITCGTNYDSATANSRLFVFLKCVGQSEMI